MGKEEKFGVFDEKPLTYDRDRQITAPQAKPSKAHDSAVVGGVKFLIFKQSMLGCSKASEEGLLEREGLYRAIFIIAIFISE